MIERPADHSSRLLAGELADPEADARAAALHPEERLRRRDFLGRTAAVAGLAGLAGVLPAETLIAEAAKQAVRTPFPKPRDLADRHLRRADDGEPLLRSLLRLAPEG